MKIKEFEEPGAWITEFIRKLTLSENAFEESVANKNLLKQSKTVKVNEAYVQVVAGINYKIYMRIENEREYEVRMYVPLPYTKSNPVIQSIKQVE